MARGEDLDALIARAQQGDVRAFEALLEAHLPVVRRFARAFAASESAVDDLAQEALLKVYKSLRLFKYQSAFSTWLYAVVRNLYIDSTKGRAGLERALEEPLQPAQVNSAAGGVRADEAIEREQERQRLWRALRKLPVEFRGAVVLFDIEGCTYDEVAAIENVPVGTVKSRLSRGRALLRGLLGEKEAVESLDPSGTSAAAAPSQLSKGGS